MTLVNYLHWFSDEMKYIIYIVTKLCSEMDFFQHTAQIQDISGHWKFQEFLIFQDKWDPSNSSMDNCQQLS